jgi:hypothetical protein
VVQSDKRIWFIQPSGGAGGRDVFVHISAVEHAGLKSGLAVSKPDHTNSSIASALYRYF